MILFNRIVKMAIKNRFILFFSFLIVFILFNYIFTKRFFPLPETQNIWFYSGLVMILFSILFIEPYYTSPKNVITNAIPLLLVFFAIRDSFEIKIFWWFAVLGLLILVICSITSIAIEDKNKSSSHKQNKMAEFLKKKVVFFGQGKLLYSSVFLYFLLTYYSTQNLYTLILFILWFFIISINPKKIRSTFSVSNKKYNNNALGEIFGIQSKNIFLAKLFQDQSIKKFDVVKFRYSVQDSNNSLMIGIIIDIYFLNQEKWIKVLKLDHRLKNASERLDKDVIYKITDETKNILFKKLNINNFVGIVLEGSDIRQLKFEYSGIEDNLTEGDLLELKIRDNRLFYQVVNGTTDKEKLEYKNEIDFVKGIAIQLGEWQSESFSFQKFGWVPPINTPIFKADTSNIEVKPNNYPNYKLGIIPNTTLPLIINLNEIMSHHTALLGVTGAGKSFIAREIIRQLQNENTKIICIDFTGEWKQNFEQEKIEDFKNIDTAIQNTKMSIIELNDVSNTTKSLEETNKKLQEIFLYAKQNSGCKKICLILEEAHTIVPETTFLGDYGDYSANKALVNKMSQIALQGRKYNVGLLVIAQRTANVSKTVLTQCNTIICFQAFDETSFTFLNNYIGKDLIQILPHLKQYHAIVVGKAVRSNLPMIIDLTRQSKNNKKEK